ncbi:hypothetical protein HanRHA438_Chr17g0842251 [Helianthus annuus]|nr:hypothetical protein HanRHA438_Chr17g0842251 [Helianthus annuus]
MGGCRSVLELKDFVSLALVVELLFPLLKRLMLLLLFLLHPLGLSSSSFIEYVGVVDFDLDFDFLEDVWLKSEFKK